jgi:23S rRNA pseudouridine1911/1915/1917 synthase
VKNKTAFIYGGAGERLDVFATESLVGFSRSIVQKLIKDGLITVNGGARKASWPLALGDNVEITLPKRKSKIKLAALTIFENKDFLIINKPEGLLVHPQSPLWEENRDAAFAAHETLVSTLLASPPKNFDETMPRVGLVHRLDRETSGVMLIAKNAAFQDAMTELFANRKVCKTYNALCCGSVKDDEGLIDVPVGRTTGGKIKASPIGRRALTGYKTLKRKNGFSYMELYPKTGRTNQLRVHLSWLGYPVLGDKLYKGAHAPRLMLHSRRLEFINPLNGKKEKFEAAPPADFNSAWESISK